MSTVKQQLTAEQQVANKTAIESFLRKACIAAGKGSIIILPAFQENSATKAWEPVMEGIGMRPTKTNSAFLRLGKATPKSNGSNVTWSYTYTNLFGTDADSLADLITYTDPQAVVGGVIRNVRVVIHESLVGKERDIKWADQKAGLKCMVEDMPVYRTTKVFFADEEGNYAPNATNILITHTNGAELSAAATIRWNSGNKPSSSAIGAAGQAALNTPVASTVPAITDEQIDARIAELEALPTPSRQQKKELAELKALPV